MRKNEITEQNLTVGERIGFGSSGEVFNVTHSRFKGRELALKVIRCQNKTQVDEIKEKYEEFIAK